MRIELRDQQRRRIGRIEVDPTLRPTRVSVLGSQREVFLNWDTSQDDAGQLRRCVACGCGDLFKEKVFPQVTGLVVIVAFAGAAVSALGMATPPVLAAMIVVLAADVAILLLPRRRLVCYRCRTSYRGLPIARYHRPWDRAVADRFAPPATTQPQLVPAPTPDEATTQPKTQTVPATQVPTGRGSSAGMRLIA